MCNILQHYLIVRLEGDPVSEIVTRYEEKLIFNTPSLEKELFRQEFTGCDGFCQFCIFLCTGNLISA